MQDVRDAISEDRVEQFLNEFLADYHGKNEIPQWVRDAAQYMGYELRI